MQHKEQIDAYLAGQIVHADGMFVEQKRNPTPAMIRLRQITVEREAHTIK